MKWVIVILKTLILIVFGLFQFYLAMVRMQYGAAGFIVILSIVSVLGLYLTGTKSRVSPVQWSVPLLVTFLFALVSWVWKLSTISNTTYSFELALKFAGILLVQWAFFSSWFGSIFETLRFKIGSFLTGVFLFLFIWLWVSSASWSQLGFIQPNAHGALLVAIAVSMIIRIRTKRNDWALSSILFFFVIAGVLQPSALANSLSLDGIQMMLYIRTWNYLIVFYGGVLIVTLVLTRRPRAIVQQLRHLPLAHRGFYSEASPENTLPAYDLAIAHHFAIECDVRLTKDQHLVMFHDDTLLRQFQDERLISDCTLDELQHLRFPNSTIGIPTFEQFLHRVHGQVLLIIELKPMGSQRRQLVEKVIQQLERYEGEFVLQSFDPLTMLWVAELAPALARGQLYFDYHAAKVSPMTRWLLAHLCFNLMTWPDFLNGYHHYHLKIAQIYRLFIPVIGFTVTSQAEFDTARSTYDNLIFEHFIPTLFRKGEV